MAFQYAFTTTSITLKPGIADASSKEVSQGIALRLAQLGGKLSKLVDTFQGGRWEVVSHDMTRIDRHLLVSVLLRRPVQSEATTGET